MLSIEDKNKLIELAKKYNVNKLYLFGSNLNSAGESNDIDLAVDGISDSIYFEFYSEIIFALSKPVDLIDLKKKSLLSKIVRDKGLLVYG